VPAVIGTGRATAILADGQAVTLSCAEGEEGRVYDGTLPFEGREIDLGAIPATRTAMMLNIATPARRCDGGGCPQPESAWRGWNSSSARS